MRSITKENLLYGCTVSLMPHSPIRIFYHTWWYDRKLWNILLHCLMSIQIVSYCNIPYKKRKDRLSVMTQCIFIIIVSSLFLCPFMSDLYDQIEDVERGAEPSFSPLGRHVSHGDLKNRWDWGIAVTFVKLSHHHPLSTLHKCTVNHERFSNHVECHWLSTHGCQ